MYEANVHGDTIETWLKCLGLVLNESGMDGEECCIVTTNHAKKGGIVEERGGGSLGSIVEGLGGSLSCYSCFM